MKKACLFFVLILSVQISACRPTGEALVNPWIAEALKENEPELTSITPNSTNQISGLQYLMAVSLPMELINSGILVSEFARTPPTVSQKILEFSLQSPKASFQKFSKVTKDPDGSFTVVRTNFPGESGYEPVDAIGQRTLIIKYFDTNGTFQSGPSQSTVRVEIEETFTLDHEVLKFESGTSKYIVTNPNASLSWLSTDRFNLQLSRNSQVRMWEKPFTYQHNGSFEFDPITGEVTKGTVEDTLRDGTSSFQARHSISGKVCRSAFQADGKEKRLAIQLPDNKDKTKTFSWVNPINSNSEILNATFSGRGTSLSQIVNDRINLLYYASPFSVSTAEEFTNTVYARGFRRACYYDSVANMIVDAAKKQYPNSLENQFYYCLGFGTTGLGSQTIDQNFGSNEYVSLPTVTLYSQIGDCEDRAILLGAIFHKIGLDVSLILLKANSAGHAVVGVNLPPEIEEKTTSGSVFFNYHGKKYYCFEPTQFVPMNEMKEFFNARGYSLMAIIPGDPKKIPTVASFRESFPTSWGVRK